MQDKLVSISGVLVAIILTFFSVEFSTCQARDTVRIGMNYPETGPYSVQGADQLRAATLAVEEVNASGGILGKPVELIIRDSMSQVDVTYKNVHDLIDNQNVSMVFGGASSAVAIAASDVCRKKRIIFFGTLTYSTDTTGAEGSRYTFRECYDSLMGAKALATFLNEKQPASIKKYFYITADYTWGHSTEESIRHYTFTEDTATHKGIRTPFPDATDHDFRKAIAFAKMINPDVLVLVLFGKDMSVAIRQATIQGLKGKVQIVVPNLTLGMAESGGAKVMEGVMGALPWTWKVPYQFNHPRGKEFVETYVKRFERYPSTSGGSAYTVVHQYKDAVERAGTTETSAVIRALEGHSYKLLKDWQTWRAFDHQSVQTVYTVKCKPAAEVMKDKFKLDYFEIIDSLPGQEAAPTREEWNAIRIKAGKPMQLERLEGE